MSMDNKDLEEDWAPAAASQRHRVTEASPGAASASPPTGSVPTGATPGPWAYDRTSGEIFYADGDVEPLVATVNLDYVNEEQAEADGLLLASAPSLFSQLTFAVKLLSAFPALSGSAQVEAMRDALAQAQGFNRSKGNE